ncbi:MAG: ribosomal protein S18-alanine N-acetyltransferase [Clostridia bacterium]|jgi:ribosomal-protein-alanine N-acetyltransferase|nr:ribosomal protein S18-alanine N-acetyltransferase [Clostridia bacterium]
MNVRKVIDSDIERLLEIEKENFPDPWTKEMFLNTSADIYILLNAEEIVGYIEVMLVIDELHINNIAISDQYKGSGASKYLYDEVIKKYGKIIGVTLEVRSGNYRAIKFYEKLGFEKYGLRKNYYTNPKEDALIMWNYAKGESK